MELEKFCEKLENEPDFAAKMAAASTTEEALSLAAEAGFTLTAEQLESIPLPDTALSAVAGGSTMERQIGQDARKKAIRDLV